MRYDDSDDDIWQTGYQLKAYLLWNWNSLNSQSFIFVRVEGRERHAGKSTMYSATYTSWCMQETWYLYQRYWVVIFMANVFPCNKNKTWWMWVTPLPSTNIYICFFPSKTTSSITSDLHYDKNYEAMYMWRGVLKVCHNCRLFVAK